MSKFYVAGAIFLSACITWVAVNKTGDHHHLKRHVSLRRSARRMQLGGPQRKRKLQNSKRKRRKRKKQNANGGFSNGGGGSGSTTIPVQQSVTKHKRWKLSENGGLSLDVLDNLVPGSDWGYYLKRSFEDWNDGIPFSLNLRSTTYDPDCAATPWAIKVCNKNYGETKWKGVNMVFLQGEYIVASLAKMNDHYARGMDWEEKAYSMCHEMGHGFGLAHSDEDFENKPLGHCMDYSNDHRTNMHPGRVDFKALRIMYGDMKENVRRLEINKLEDHKDEKSERLLRADFEKYAAHLAEPSVVSSEMVNTVSGLRILHKSDTAEIHERRLGNGYSMRTTFLLA